MSEQKLSFAKRSLVKGCVQACPACQHRHLSKAESEQQKFQWLANKLSPWAEQLQPVKAVDEAFRLHYRHKMTLLCQFFTGLEAAEENPQQLTGWQFGMVHRQQLIPIPKCPAHSKNIIQIVDLLLKHIPDFSETFSLKWLNISGGQLTLVFKQKAIPNMNWLDDHLQAQLTALGVEGFWLHMNPCTGKKIFAKNQWQLFFGQPRSKDLAGLYYGPAAFQQLIPELYHHSLKTAADFLQLEHGDRIIDLYCGSGNSINYWLPSNAQVLGVELAGESLACAKDNFAIQIDTGQLTLLRGACNARIQQYAPWISQVKPTQQKVYVNPPRTGLEAEVCQWLCQSNVSRLAYLSCSAGTLKQDLSQLCQAGFQVEEIIPYDFFPQTHHVETLVLLKR